MGDVRRNVKRFSGMCGVFFSIYKDRDSAFQDVKNMFADMRMLFRHAAFTEISDFERILVDSEQFASDLTSRAKSMTGNIYFGILQNFNDSVLLP